MKRLRKLAEGWEYGVADNGLLRIERKTDYGSRSEPFIHAPPECFADDPAEPKQEPPEVSQARHWPVPEYKPKPPQETLKPGQWVEDGCVPPCKEVVVSGPVNGCYEVEVRVGRGVGKQVRIGSGYLRPCPPSLTDAMKLLCWRGTRVRRIERPVGADGKPYEKDSDEGKVGTALDVGSDGLVRISLDAGGEYTSYPWNLKPAEEK